MPFAAFIVFVGNLLFRGRLSAKLYIKKGHGDRYEVNPRSWTG